jgi:hypothetical protein
MTCVSAEPPDHICEARAIWQHPDETAQMPRPQYGSISDSALPANTWQQQGAGAPQHGQYLQPYAPGYPQVQARAQGDGLAVASMVLGITSIVFCWWGLATLAQVVLAIVLGVKGMRRADAGAGGKGMAIAGLVCGCVGALAYLIFGVATLGAGFII